MYLYVVLLISYIESMNKKEKTLLKSQHKKEIRERRLNNLATRLKSNILKRKKSMLANKNG